MQTIIKYFPQLNGVQKEQFEALFDLYKDWNAKINVISRKDIDNLYLHHVLHSLSIAKYIDFKPGTKVLDVGTGGGFPGVPLAIFFPEVEFVLLDSIRKKVRVAQEISDAIGLKNISFIHERMENEKRQFDFVISRAVMQLPELVKRVDKNVSPKHMNAMPNGLICLKGGDLEEELSPFKKTVEAFPLDTWFEEPFFETKQLVYLPL